MDSRRERNVWMPHVMAHPGCGTPWEWRTLGVAGRHQYNKGLIVSKLMEEKKEQEKT